MFETMYEFLFEAQIFLMYFKIPYDFMICFYDSSLLPLFRVELKICFEQPWLRVFFKVFFTQKCIKIMFFLFFKNHF